MMEAALYLIQVSCCIGVFYCLYLVFFKRTTFFVINRFYLLGCLVLSFVIPSLELQLVAPDIHIMSVDFITASFETGSGDDPGTPGEVTAKSIDFPLLIGVVYWTGFAIMIFRLVFSILRIIRIKNRSSARRLDNTNIVDTNLSHPFSFINWIFLPKHTANSLILEHEKVHIHQLHWIDLLVVEITSVILWFNPIMIFYRRSVKIQHEYLADASTIQNGAQLKPYLNCMLLQIQFENEAEPISQFYSQTIKNRITMMTKNKTARKFRILYLLFLPAVCLLLVAFSTPSAPDLFWDNNVRPVKDGEVIIILDAGHGGQDIGARAKEGTSEKDFTLSIAKIIQKEGEKKGIKVVLTRTGDEGLTLAERLAIADRFSATVFISLHANYDQQNASTSGMECVVSESNKQFANSKRLAEQLVSQLKTLNGIAVNGIKKSNPYLLKTNIIPAVILELGYLSNSADCNYIGENGNQKLISERILTAVKEYSK